MSAKVSDYSLHEVLKAYLKRNRVVYEPIVARVISTSPVQITQDGLCYLELTSFGKILRSDPELARLDLQNGQVLLRLLDWKFIYSKIPNDVEYYLDIEVKRYELNDYFDFKIPLKASEACINLLETPPFKRLYEEELASLKHNIDLDSSDHESPTGESSKKQDSSKVETRGDSNSNHNKSSLRKKQLQGRSDKETKENGTGLQSPHKKLDYTEARPTLGLGVSGLNGKEHMKKLRAMKNIYVTNSQDSLTDQLLFGSTQNLMPNISALCGEEEDSNVNKDMLNKRSLKDVDEAELPRFHPLSESSNPQFVTLSDKDLMGEGDPIKHLKPPPPRSEITFQQSRCGDGLNYDELMDCLSPDLGLLRWDELVFGSEVVRFLKGHMQEFSKQ